MTKNINDFVAVAKLDEDILEEVMADTYRALLSHEVGPFSIVDGGAHQGGHTYQMTLVPGCERVYAVEANQTLASKLLEMGPTACVVKTELVSAAIQNDPEVTEITFMQSESHIGRSGISSIFQDDPEVKFENLTVPATTIDKATANRTSPIRFIKLDLEGGEYNAVRGALSVLATDRPVIAMENSIYSPRINGYSIDEYFEFYRSIGYTPVTFLGEVMTAENIFELWYAWAAPNEKVDLLCSTLKSQILSRLP
jgi:FkbM family methyltransferase